MNPTEVLSITKQRGIILEADGNQIKYKSPPGAMTADLIETIRTHKQLILEILNSDRKPVKCLGVVCSNVNYQNVSGSPWLWCGHINKAVVNLTACPFENWRKDATGFPKSARTDELSGNKNDI